MSNILYHLFLISSSVKGMFSFLITLSHLSFQIRCTDSDTSILQRWFAPRMCFPSSVLNSVSEQHIIFPVSGQRHPRLFFSHSRSAKSHITFWPGDSHWVRIWSIDSTTPQCVHSLLLWISSLKLPFSQYLPIW